MGQGWSLPFGNQRKKPLCEVRLLASPRAKGLYNHWEIQVNSKRYGFHPLGVYQVLGPVHPDTKCIKVATIAQPLALVDDISSALGKAKYQGAHYHPLARNCEHFARELFLRLSAEAKQLAGAEEAKGNIWAHTPYPHDVGAATVSLMSGIVCPPLGFGVAALYMVSTRVAPPVLARWGFS